MPPRLQQPIHALRDFLLDAGRVYLTLLRVMVPALIAVKALDLFGATVWLAWLLSPLMRLVGLPDEMGIVWAAAMLTNIYTALAVYADIGPGTPLSVAQVSVLGTMILLAHSLPVEGAVARAAGVRWGATLALRIGGALVLGALLHLVYAAAGILQEPARMLWQPPAADPTLAGWALDQLHVLVMVFFIIAALMAMLRLLRLLGIERLMHWLLTPLLKFIGVGREAANVTIIGATLGISFGAGLLIREARGGHLSARDIFLTLAFLGLCHSVIEDTLLILLLGADLSAILWARLAFALLVTAALARLPGLAPAPRDA
ncbi:hypothetical protein E6C76_07310 [Pseudothauera nasutitermitis]|uniref:Nucleoside recognition protein n=1 Tax=Pseudothauera nasutitermitis TaxID=2565930 RepID=A0A4S4B2A0_9RHOO|nr:hypothetical protein [Pseudothauera nasutitermitis]THF66623.1 hypothetical protein E6C76_07310 [Pseudothauera nasutitermitis]